METCVSAPIPANTMQSMIFYGPTLTGCEPATGPMPDVPLPWKTHALACGGIMERDCPGDDEHCQASRGAFSACIHRMGNEPMCPEGYTRKLVFYEDVDDTRDCAPCACGEPEGSNCRTYWKWFDDSECTDHYGAAPCNIDSSMCEDFGAPTVRLLSMDAMFLPEFNPGSCTPSGGEPIGEVVPQGPTTFCCEDPPEAAGGSAM